MTRPLDPALYLVCPACAAFHDRAKLLRRLPKHRRCEGSVTGGHCLYDLNAALEAPQEIPAP